MAVEWKWSEKCGEVTFKRETGFTYTSNLYVGNCFLIMINEWEEDGKGKYALNSFFVDSQHMERCLKNNIFTEYDKLISIKINKAKCRNYKKIVALLAEYMDDIDISVYKDGEYTWEEYKSPEPTIPDIRMREIAELAIDALVENNDYWEEDLADMGLDLSNEEREYFCLPLKEDEED